VNVENSTVYLALRTLWTMPLLHVKCFWACRGLPCLWHYVLLPLHPFNGLFSRKTWVRRYWKGKTSLDLNEARDDGVWGCSGISWTIRKQSAPRSRQITTPTPHQSILTGRMLFLTPNQQCQSSRGKVLCIIKQVNRTYMCWAVLRTIRQAY